MYKKYYENSTYFEFDRWRFAAVASDKGFWEANVIWGLNTGACNKPLGESVLLVRLVTVADGDLEFDTVVVAGIDVLLVPSVLDTITSLPLLALLSLLGPLDEGTDK